MNRRKGLKRTRSECGWVWTLRSSCRACRFAIGFLAPQRYFGSSEVAGSVDNFFQPTRLKGESTWTRFL